MSLLLTVIRYAIASLLFLLALYLFAQLLSLIFVQRFAELAADAESTIRIPIALKILASAANSLQTDVVNTPERADMSNWPFGFQLFFILELSGLAGVCIAVTQFGAGLLKRRNDWIWRASSTFFGSCIAMLLGILLLKLIR